MPDPGLSAVANVHQVATVVDDLMSEHQRQQAALLAAERRWNDPTALRIRLRELSEGVVRVAAVGILVVILVVVLGAAFD